jgi:hypothetical protein
MQKNRSNFQEPHVDRDHDPDTEEGLGEGAPVGVAFAASGRGPLLNEIPEGERALAAAARSTVNNGKGKHQGIVTVSLLLQFSMPSASIPAVAYFTTSLSLHALYLCWQVRVVWRWRRARG